MEEGLLKIKEAENKVLKKELLDKKAKVVSEGEITKKMIMMTITQVDFLSQSSKIWKVLLEAEEHHYQLIEVILQHL